MEKKRTQEDFQREYERRESAKKTLSIINFPEQLQTKEIVEIMVNIKFGGSEKGKSIFKNSVVNKMNGKFNYNLQNDNFNFNISPLFIEYFNKEKKLDKLNEDDLKVHTDFCFSALKFQRLFEEKILVDDLYQDVFFKLCKDKIVEGKYEKNFIATYHTLKNIKKHIEIEDEIVYFYDYMDKILDHLGKCEEKYGEIRDDQSAFNFSTEIVKLDILSEIYFNTLTRIYIKLKKDKCENLNDLIDIVKNYLGVQSNIFEKYHSPEDTLYGYFYYYQNYKSVEDNMGLYDLLLKKESLEFYKNIIFDEKNSLRSYRVPSTNQIILNKKRMMEILNETDGSNFSRNIKMYEKFIDLYKKEFPDTFKTNLKNYAIYYQELYHNVEQIDVGLKNTNNSLNMMKKFVRILGEGKSSKLHPVELKFIILKLQRCQFIMHNSVEDYRPFMEYQKLIREVYLKNLYDRSGKNLFEIIKKCLIKYKEINKNDKTKYFKTTPMPRDLGINLNNPYKEFKNQV